MAFGAFEGPNPSPFLLAPDFTEPTFLLAAWMKINTILQIIKYQGNIKDSITNINIYSSHGSLIKILTAA